MSLETNGKGFRVFRTFQRTLNLLMSNLRGRMLILLYHKHQQSPLLQLFLQGLDGSWEFQELFKTLFLMVQLPSLYTFLSQSNHHLVNPMLPAHRPVDHLHPLRKKDFLNMKPNQTSSVSFEYTNNSWSMIQMVRSHLPTSVITWILGQVKLLTLHHPLHLVVHLQEEKTTQILNGKMLINRICTPPSTTPQFLESWTGTIWCWRQSLAVRQIVWSRSISLLTILTRRIYGASISRRRQRGWTRPPILQRMTSQRRTHGALGLSRCISPTKVNHLRQSKTLQCSKLAVSSTVLFSRWLRLQCRIPLLASITWSLMNSTVDTQPNQMTPTPSNPLTALRVLNPR